MNFLPDLASLPEPARFARWLLAVFAASAVGSMSLLGDGMDAFDVILTAWIVGPAALAAGLAFLVRSKTVAWLLVGAQAVAVVSTLWMFVDLSLRTGHENAQASLVLFILPLFQFAGLASYASAVIGAALIVRAWTAGKSVTASSPRSS